MKLRCKSREKSGVFTSRLGVQDIIRSTTHQVAQKRGNRQFEGRNMTKDERYLNIVLEPIYVCADYRPKMGHSSDTGYELAAFQEMYRAGPFYNWLGLHNPLMYAAHKAAGGMTSIYRQIGIGCERLFRQILIDKLNLSIEEADWSYETKTSSGRTRVLRLDACIPVDAVRDLERRAIIKDWMQRAAEEVGVAEAIRDTLTGIVFEVDRATKVKTVNARMPILQMRQLLTRTLICLAFLSCRIKLMTMSRPVIVWKGG